MRRVFVLDSYHLGDPLFVRQFARSLADLAEPSILVHGSAEEGERALESDGIHATREGGVLITSSEAGREAVENATRALNRRIVDQLTDEGVAAIRIDGTSRGLLQHEADGSVRAANAAWLWDLTAKQVVPVVASLVADADGHTIEVNPGHVAAALVADAQNPSVTFLTVNPLPSGPTSAEVPQTAVEHVSAELAAVRSRGVTVLLSHARRLGEWRPYEI